MVVVVVVVVVNEDRRLTAIPLEICNSMSPIALISIPR